MVLADGDQQMVHPITFSKLFPMMTSQNYLGVRLSLPPIGLENPSYIYIYSICIAFGKCFHIYTSTQVHLLKKCNNISLTVQYDLYRRILPGAGGGGGGGLVSNCLVTNSSSLAFFPATHCKQFMLTNRQVWLHLPLATDAYHRDADMSLVGCERIHCSQRPIGDAESQQKEGDQRIEERGHDGASRSGEGTTKQQQRKRKPKFITIMIIHYYTTYCIQLNNEQKWLVYD